MKIAKDIWSDLLEKKLWPVAAILVAMVVGVPMMLSKPGDPVPAAAVPNVASNDDTGPELSLTRATNTGFQQAPHVNTKSLDPFGDRSNAAVNKMVKSVNDQLNSLINSASGNSGTSGGTPIDTGVTPDTSGGGGGGGGGTPNTEDPTTTTPTKVKTESDDVLSLLVQESSGGTDADPQELDDIRTLSPLTDPEDPFLVYVGKAGTGAASFLVSSDATPTSTSGGKCDPSPTDCRTLTLKIGETATFTRPGKVTEGSTTPGPVRTVKVTVVDVETKKVPVDGDAATASAARLETKARVVGAKALKKAIVDRTIVKSLMRHHVKIRG